MEVLDSVRLTTGYPVSDPTVVKNTYNALASLVTREEAGFQAALALLLRCENHSTPIPEKYHTLLQRHGLVNEANIDPDIAEIVQASLWRVDHEGGLVELRLVSPVNFPIAEL